ncbi:phage tail tube protein [Jeongeupia sp. USM3]|uniref:phage tail tube protein n=1 Tax=Jeongeupia sp. USM3 TaxID=1906741 RepID=UPI00089DF507|nr:phage tail tube protein [Jeongeupia sp. USM3]AOY00100.1 hypothetical protein BJP62_06330 [Jeongeupia sp. USM3]
MGTKNRLAGTCYIKVGGAQLDVQGGVEAPISTISRESLVALNQRVVGYKESTTAPYVKVSAFVGKDFPIGDLTSNDDMTVTAEFANGRVYVLRNAWLTEGSAYSAEDGTVELQFEGKEGIWQ